MVGQLKAEELKAVEETHDCGCGCGGAACETAAADCGCGCGGVLSEPATQELIFVGSITDWKERAPLPKSSTAGAVAATNQTV